MASTHKQRVLNELDKLVDGNFKIPAGLCIPVGTQVLIEETVQGEFKMKSGLIIPKTGHLAHCRIGTVYAIGESCHKPLREGFKVAFDKHAPNIAVAHDDRAFLCIEEHFIFAVIPPENYLRPHYADTEERRRAERISTTKRIKAKTDRNIDALDNGTEEDYRRVTGGAAG